MPNYTSPALYIDFARLPPPAVIEELNYEDLVTRYRAEVLAKNSSLQAALQLEQSPTNVILEAQSYGELLVRARVNAAARAVMLAFSTGTDLENLAAFFNVQRMVGELDDSLRRRTQLAPEAFSTAGSEGAYIFQALSADVRVRDATATRMDDRGTVRIAVMQNTADPTPTEDVLLAVSQRLNQKGIRPLTDMISVVPVKVFKTDIAANITLYPGPDSSVVMKDIGNALTKVRSNITLIGRDLTRSAIISALNQSGVQSVDLISPAKNIAADNGSCVIISSASITPLPMRQE
jgi:phage-related baseplate assembly protein